MSKNDDGSNDDLTYLDDDSEENQQSNNHAENSQYSEQYVNPENDYYTTEYDDNNYLDEQDDSHVNQQTEPSVFVSQYEDNYSNQADLYSTDLTNNMVENEQDSTQYLDQNQQIEQPTPQYFESTADYETDQFGAVEPTNYQSDSKTDSEGYRPVEDYLEESTYPDQTGYGQQIEPSNIMPHMADTSSLNGLNPSTDQILDDLTLDEQLVSTEGSISQTDQRYFPTETNITDDNIQSASSDEQYYSNSEQIVSDQFHDEAFNDDRDLTTYDDTLTSDTKTFESKSYADEEINADQYSNSDQFSGRAISGHLKQDFRQEYVKENLHKNRIYSLSWLVSGGLVALLLGVFYFSYNYFTIQGTGEEIPVILADKSDIKRLPGINSIPKDDLTSGKNTDRILSDVGVEKTQEVVQKPELLSSREEVVEQPTKLEDRVETSNSVTPDNEDKDIQNILTLINSSADNAEILLKSDDISTIDQNQINLSGLETILVTAKPVKLNDLISQNTQKDEIEIAPVKTLNIDDLPVVSQDPNDPFKVLLDDKPTALPEIVNSATDITTTIATQLPEATSPIEITTADIQAVADSQELPEVVKTETPKPIVIASNPVSVPNSLAPAVVASSGGDYGVQLTSLPNEAAARNAYTQILKKFPTILADYRPIIKQADVEGKGRFYRLFAGPLNSYIDANKLCAALRSAGISGCFARKM